MVDVRKPSKRISVSGPSPSGEKPEKAAEIPSIYPVKRISTAPRRPSQAPSQSSADTAATTFKRPSTLPATNLPTRKVSFSQERPSSAEPVNANSQIQRSSYRPSSAQLPGQSASLLQQAQTSKAENDKIVDQTLAIASLRTQPEDTSKELEEVAKLRQQVEDGKTDVARLAEQVADRDKEINNLKQRLKAQGEVNVEDEKDLTYSLDPFLKCQGCGRPNLYGENEHPLLRATEDSKWLAYELGVLEKNRQLYTDIEHKLLQIKDLVEQNQMPEPGTVIEPFFQPKPGTDAASFCRAKDPNDKVLTKLCYRDFSKGKRGNSFECGLIYTDCSQVLDVCDPPAVLAIEEIPSLMHKEINEFLTSRGLREFDSATYNWFVIPGLPLNRDAKTFENFTNAAVVIYPKDEKFVWNNKMLNSQLRYYLSYLADKTDELVRRLQLHEDCMEAFWHERSYFNKEVLSKQVWPKDAKSERGAKGLIADMLTLLKKRVVEKETEASKLQAQLQASEKRGDEHMRSLQEAKVLLVKKDEAVSYYNHALQTCRNQVKTMKSQSEETESQIFSLQQKLQAMADPMCKIWTKSFLESVRRKIGQELLCAFSDVIPLEERAYPHVMQSWNATLSKIYDNPDACALLASKGLQQDLLELTRVGAHHRDGQQTLQHLGTDAASIAGKAQIAEAISSLDLEETRRKGLKQLYRYVYGSDSVAEDDRKALTGP